MTQANDLETKFRARRWNEHIKSAYSLLNTLAAAVVVTGFVAPTISLGTEKVDLDARAWIVIGLGIHAFGQFLIWRLMRRED